MITESNLQSALKEIGFKPNNNNIYKIHFTKSKCNVEVDFAKKEIKYPDSLKVFRTTTLNFSENENFVVLDCVCRLLKQGYKPEHICLEAPIPGGRADEKAGFSDILVVDNDETPYMIIECKTPKSKTSDEFSKEWAKTKKSGGQLFNYFNTYRQAKYLVLYTCDYEIELVPTYNTITLIDNNDFLKSNKNLKSYDTVRQNNGSHAEYHWVWKNTYQHDYSTNGVFEENIQPFNTGNKKLCADDLIEIDSISMQKKYNQYATILRQYNVSSKENAFDKLINLFIAKIIDETYNANELKCYWKGAAYDNYYDLHDRLHELYKIGMEEFFHDKITFIENTKIEEAFKFIVNNVDEAKNTIFGYIRELKYFNNNPFAILDVHNEELFNFNAIILKEVVRLLQDIKLKSDKQNQFLGDLFEGFLDQGVKQSEGQFFTPMPIVRFLVSSLPLEKIIQDSNDIPKAIDYACGAGHFLTEYANQIKPYVTKFKNSDIHGYYDNIIGIEKEYRLSKVSQVSAYMYGQDGIRIRYKDALSSNIEGVNNATFSVLIANPPYSVKGFLETLEDEDLEKFELTELISDRSKNNSIEVFFVEKAKQLLKDDGVAAIILPSTILSNNGIYISCREILLKYFEIIAIVSLGSKTFGKTNTNTVTLFLRRRSRKPDLSEHYKNRVDSWFKGIFDDDYTYGDREILEQYCDKICVEYNDYLSLLNGKPNTQLLETDIFSEYIEVFGSSAANSSKGINAKATKIKQSFNATAKSKKYQGLSDDEQKNILDKAKIDFIIEIEKEKLYYYMLATKNEKNVIIVKSPKKAAEQKQFLGYDWSDAKGNEGIKYLNIKDIDDEDTAVIERIRGIDNIETPLFDPRDLQSDKKINTFIRNNFLASNTNPVIPEDLKEYIDVIPLSSLIDFNKPYFNKEIKLSAARKTIINSNYDQYKIKTLVDPLGGLWTGKKQPFTNVAVIRNANFTFNGEINKEKIEYIDAETNQLEKRYLKKGDIIIEKSGGSETQAVGRVVLFDLEDDKYTYSNFTARLRIKKEKKKDILPEYLHIMLSYLYLIDETFYYQSGSSGLKNLSLSDYLAISIPVPPISNQKNVILEYKKINEEYKTTRMTKQDYAKKIIKLLSDLKIIN